MIREPRNNFDEHIKEALQGFEMPFESDDWALMEQALDREESAAGLALFFSNKYLQLGVAAALLLCVLYHVNPWVQDTNTGLAKYEMSPAKTTPINSNQTAATQNLNEQATTVDVMEADKTNLTANNTAAAKAFSMEKANAQESAPSEESNRQTAALFDVLPSKTVKTNNTIHAYDEKNTLTFQNEPILTEQIANEYQFSRANTSKTIDDNVVNQQASKYANVSNGNETALSSDFSTTKNSAAAANEMAQKTTQPQQVNPSFANEIIKNIIALDKKTAVVTDKENANTLANMSKDVQTLSDFSSLVEMPKVPREKANMTIGSHSSIDINFLEGNYPEAGLSTGFSFQMGKNKRWGFQTGAFYTYKNYPTVNFTEEDMVLTGAYLSDGDNNYTINSSRAVTIQERYDLFSIRAFFLEIPFLVTHNFRPQSTINPYIAAGASIWLPTSLQKTNYKSQTIATYDYVTALQNLNDRSNAEQVVNVRNPDFVVTDATTLGIDSNNVNNEFPEEITTNYINVIPDYHTAISEEAVNQTIGKSRAYWDILQIQAGLDMKMSKRWSFQLAGQVKASLFKHALNRHAIQHLPSVDKRLHTIGIQMGVTCTL